MDIKEKPLKGRGALSRQSGRFESLVRDNHMPQWPGDVQQPSNITRVAVDNAKSIITYNRSPDVPFDRSINPYQGCEHGCIYCFARPTHAYYGMSAGLDFEQRLFAKQNAAELLEKELSVKNYRPEVIAIGANTDAYQPIERQYAITRDVLDVLQRYRHPCAIITKSSLIERDIDILSDMARDDLVKVMISITTLDKHLAYTMEPRASTPQRRLQTIRALHDANVPVGVLVAPIIPALNDYEIENILVQCQQAGAQSAGYVMLRLPLELRDLFEEWLEENYPLKKAHVLKQIRAVREGALYNNQFGKRMQGSGPVAEMIRQRFQLAVKKLQFNIGDIELNTKLFNKLKQQPDQLSLF